MSTETSTKKPLAPEDATTVVSARLFAAVATFRAIQDIRYYLNGVHIAPCEAGGVFVVATNGHQMAVAHDPDGRTDEAVILHCSPAMEKAARERMHSLDAAVVVVHEGRVRLLGPEELFVQAGEPLVPGKFPDFFKVLEGGVGPLTDGLTGAFSANLTKKLSKIAELLAPKFSTLHHWTTKDGYLLTRFTNEPKLSVVTMPVRDERPKDGALPAVLSAAVQKAKDERLAAIEAEANAAVEKASAEGAVSV